MLESFGGNIFNRFTINLNSNFEYIILWNKLQKQKLHQLGFARNRCSLSGDCTAQGWYHFSNIDRFSNLFSPAPQSQVSCMRLRVKCITRTSEYVSDTCFANCKPMCLEKLSNLPKCWTQHMLNPNFWRIANCRNDLSHNHAQITQRNTNTSHSIARITQLGRGKLHCIKNLAHSVSLGSVIFRCSQEPHQTFIRDTLTITYHTQLFFNSI